ncbi:hypothetical protein KR032_001670 [Drosophila birchii]|nr:hypothetical protein KR032_001670 [Drosophila birchii]
MYNFLAANENKRRPQAAIGSERAARLVFIENLDHARTAAPQDNLGINPGLDDCWPNSGGEITPAPPRALATIESDQEALGNLYPRRNLAEIKIIQGPEATMYKAPVANENEKRPQAAIGSERAARLAIIENRDPGRNLNRNVPQANCWPNSAEGWTPAPPRVMETIEPERIAQTEGLAARQLQLSKLSLPLSPCKDNADVSFSVSPNTHWSNTGVVPGWQKDPLTEVQPRSGYTFSTFPPEKAAKEAVKKQQKLDSSLQPERVPHPDRNPLPTPTPKATLATGPEGLYLLFDKTPVQVESPWLSMLSELKEKAESNPLPELPELPLPLYDERELDDLHYVQAKNHRLAEHILSQMPNEQSSHRFQHELLRRQLRSEQQLTSFLEKKLSQVSIAPESESHWMSWVGNGEDMATAGGEWGGKNVE